MHDSVATFYGGYDQVATRRLAPARVPWTRVALVLAVIVLLVVVAADVAAVTTSAVPVRITAIDWYAEGGLLTSTSGLTVRGGTTFVATLECSTVCFRVTGVTAAAPFQVAGVLISYSPDQWVNVTVRAPTSSYDGPLTLTIELP